MIKVPFGYNYSETLYSYFVEYHIYLKSLLNIFICSTAMPNFPFFFKALIFENYMRSNLTKKNVFKNGTQNNYLKSCKHWNSWKHWKLLLADPYLLAHLRNIPLLIISLRYHLWLTTPQLMPPCGYALDGKKERPLSGSYSHFVCVFCSRLGV